MTYSNSLNDIVSIYKVTLNLMAFTKVGFFLASSVTTASGTWTNADNGTYPGNTPAGNPASWTISAKTIPDKGAISDGFKTIVHPAAKAGITFRVI